jgi:hydroxypyruvate reductase
MPEFSPSLEEDVRAIFEAAVRRVQPDRLIAPIAPADALPRPLEAYGRVQVVGMGKAAMAMAGEVEECLGDAVGGGTVVVPEGYPETLPERLAPPARIDVCEGGHPVPTVRSERAARRLLRCAQDAGPDDGLLVLVSGGGTALTTLPAADLPLNAVQHVFRLLLRSGAAIHEVNVVRKHLTQVGGGQLAQAAQPADVAAWVVSDVVGDDLSTIASGPTVPDPSTYADAVRVLYRHGLWHDVAAPIREHLAAGADGTRPETPSEDASCFASVQTHLLGTNRMALAAARAAAEARGYRARIVGDEVEGEAREVGRDHVQQMRTAEVARPTCWLWGGETTVTVRGEGKGGRNQELALAGAIAMEKAAVELVLLSGGTDGIDGPTDAAGAWATPETAGRARARGLDAGRHLKRNDAYSFFDALGQLLRPGPTHTNVMDVHVGLARPQ